MNNTMKPKAEGKSGEINACDYLKGKGYEIIEQNFKNKIGEIDIICKKDDRIIFIEVKTRSTAKYGVGGFAVNEAKMQKIRLVATAYLKKKKLLESKMRFDVIEILYNKIRHIENAF